MKIGSKYDLLDTLRKLKYLWIYKECTVGCIL